MGRCYFQGFGKYGMNEPVSVVIQRKVEKRTSQNFFNDGFEDNFIYNISIPNDSTFKQNIVYIYCYPDILDCINIDEKYQREIDIIKDKAHVVSMKIVYGPLEDVDYETTEYELNVLNEELDLITTCKFIPSASEEILISNYVVASVLQSEE